MLVLLDKVCTDEHHRAKVEIIAQRTLLVVYHRMTLCLAVGLAIIVRIHHHGMCVVRRTQHAFQRILPHEERRRLCNDKSIFRL